MFQKKDGRYDLKSSKSKTKKDEMKNQKGLSISDAKLGLSIKYEIPVENIEFIMKG